MYFRNILSIVIISCCLAGCAAGLYLPTEEDALKQEVSLLTLNSGRELYINKCSGCHNIYLPASYTKEEWLTIMDKMQKPAKIDSTQKELIMRYLVTCAKQ